MGNRSKKYLSILYYIIMLILGLSMGWWSIPFFLFSILIWYFSYYKNNDLKNKKKIDIPNYLLVIPVMIFVVSRFMPFMVYGSHPLGYDTGFYNYNIEMERTVVEENGFLSPPTKILAVESLGNRLINRLFILLGLNNWSIIYLVYILSGVLTGYMLYLLSKLYFGKNVAFFSAVIYSLSFTQYLAYWEMFWKNSIALGLMLLVFYLFENKKKNYNILPWLIILLIFITHKTSAFILFITLLFYFLFSKNKNKIVWIFLLSIFALIIAWINRGLLIYIWEEIISGFRAHYDFFSIRAGIFISGQEFLKYSFFYLPFAALAILEMIFLKRKNLSLILFFLTFIVVITKFIFYKRFYFYLDISLIIFSGLYIYKFFNNTLNIFSYNAVKFFSAIILLFSIFFFFSGVKAIEPLVTNEEIKLIKDIKNFNSELKVFTYNSYYTPWLYGFSGHKVIAPGWGDLRWNLKKWQIFWTSNYEQRKNMLLEFDQPLIMYLYDDFFKAGDDDCFKKINSYFYLFQCDEKN